MRVKIFGAATAALLITATASAQDDPAHLSLVAGYKAAFTCSGVFNAGRTPDEIADDELHRIYSGYRDAMANLPDAVIDEANKNVAVAYLDGMAPRVAQWRPYLGCVQLPTGASIDDVDLPIAKVRQNRRLPIPLPEAMSDDLQLLAMVEAAFDRESYGEGTETTAVVIVRDGAVVAEKYRHGFDAETPQRTWSVAKSIAVTILGAAVEDGVLSVDEPAALAAWSTNGDPRGDITIENLLHMSSGLTSSAAGNRTDDVYFGGGRIVDHAITNRLVATPGALWRYANNDTMIAMRVLRERVNNDSNYLRYPFEKVLLPLGMDRTFLETDWNGDFVLSSQVWTTARDLARLGLLYLNDGVWNGERILPDGWAHYVATPAPAQPPRQRANGSPYPGYGAQFWLYGARDGLPEGSYAARGNRGQYLMIVPARNMLIIRRGFDDGGGFDLARFSADLIAALDAGAP